MGTCIYCGQPAGFLKKYHRECRDKYEKGKEKIINEIKKFIRSDLTLRELEETIKSTAHNSFITEYEFKDLVKQGWEKAVDYSLEDNLLTEEEEMKLLKIIENFFDDTNFLKDNLFYKKMIQGIVLREVMEGEIPERIVLENGLPFNLQKSEKLIWIFDNVEYLEMRTYKNYSGGYNGVSIRVAKGVYFKAGGFKGKPIEKNEIVPVDIGVLAITNKHLYFKGSIKTFRIKYDKIISFDAFSNGIGIHKDGKTSKPMFFKTGDGWFVYNLVVNLARNFNN